MTDSHMLTANSDAAQIPNCHATPLDLADLGFRVRVVPMQLSKFFVHKSHAHGDTSHISVQHHGPAFVRIPSLAVIDFSSAVHTSRITPCRNILVQPTPRIQY
jgi:hypothetical protein